MSARRRKPSPSDAALAELRTFGLAYPGAHRKSPWPGHDDLAVKDKTFAYLSVAGEPFSIGCKLPHSCAMALNLPYVQPTPYGLGKSGWVTATPPAGKPVPVELFKAWIDESYRAQAPKTLVKQLPPSASGPLDEPPARARQPAKRARRAKRAVERSSRRRR